MKLFFNLLLFIVGSYHIVFMPTSVGAQSLMEQEVGKRIYIKELRLLPDSVKGIYFGYVEEDTKPGNGKYFCGAMTSYDSDSAMNTISKALSSIPDNAIKKLNLEYVLLCGSTEVNGQPIGGIPVPPLNLLMISVGGNNNDEYLQHMFAHEFYHFVEYRFNTFRDTEWNKLFGNGYANNYNGLMRHSSIGTGKPGFLNSYAMTFPHEERAELFSFLFLKPTVLSDYIDTKDDKLLKRKADYMIKKSDEMLGLDINL